MSRGLQTLFHKRHLMNPVRHGRFAWMLISHKLIRWLVPWALLAGTVGAAIIPIQVQWARVPVTAAAVLTALVALIGWVRPEGRVPRPAAAAAYVVWGVVAGLHAWVSALRGDLTPTWEPTRRDVVEGPASGG
jgi:hypothetical protein